MANFDVIAILKANVSDFKKGMKEAEGTIKGFQKASGSMVQKIGGLVSGAGKALTIGVTAPLVAAGTKAYLMAADMEDALGATEQIFGSAANEVKSWASNLESYYGIAESDALQYGNTMGAMLKNIGGLSEKEAAKTAGNLVELAGDLSAMFGGSTDSAIQALTGALKGNNSMLDNYGMGVNEATIKAKAFEMGLSDGTGELTLQQKQAATLALIMEQTADAQGQAAREADGASGSMKGLITEIKNLTTELGQELIPIITPFIRYLRDLVGKFKGLSDEQKENVAFWIGIAAAIGPVLWVVGKVIAGIKILGAVFAFLTSPIGLVIAVIAVLVGWFVYAWNTNEDFRNGIINGWNNIKEGAKQLASDIKTWFGNMVDTIKETGTNIINKVKETWNKVTTSISNAVGKAKEAAGNVMQGVIDTITGWFGNFAEAGANIVGMIADGIRGAVGKVTSAIGGVTSKIRAYLPFSPAKKGALRDIHRLNFGGTIADSIKRDSFKPIQAVSDLTQGIRSAWSNDVGRLQANVGGSVKRDIQTSVNVQSNGMNSLLAQLLNREQYLVLDTGAFVGQTQHAYDKANGAVINLGKRVKR